MKKKLQHTTVSVKLRKSEIRNEWYLYVEAYPVYEKENETPKRVREYVKRIITTPIWDKKRPTRGGFRPKRDINVVIMCKSQIDQESCIYAAQIVTQQTQYQNTVVGNPDTEAAERMFLEILNRAMAQQRNADLSLYRQFRADETFRHDFANLVHAAIENVDYLTSQQYTVVPNTSTSLAAEP